MMTREGLKYRRFDLRREDPEAIFRLFERVYGNSRAIRDRWEWEFHRHPRAEEIALWVAESTEGPVGMTVRMPVTLAIRGEIRRGCFASNSMVDPAYRGCGIIGELYDRAAETGVIQLSKGTAAGMYKVLKRMGYRDILPNTFQVRLLAPLRWVWGKISKNRPEAAIARSEGPITPFRQIDRFPEEFDRFAFRAVSGECGGIFKNADHMNWRYLDTPHWSYRAYLRESNNGIVSSVVLRISGSSATLVDILWDPDQRDEPAISVRFARKASLCLGAVKLVAWGSAQALRRELRSQLFFENSETPHFSFRYPGGDGEAIDWSSVNIVHGDGDAEYL
jgi:GNAT superfamily N-acetyltransferase